jgi:hypothetical protein
MQGLGKTCCQNGSFRFTAFFGQKCPKFFKTNVVNLLHYIHPTNPFVRKKNKDIFSK